MVESIESPTLIEPEFVQDAAEVEALAAAEVALVEYLPKSKSPKLNTLIPRNMAFEVQKALNAVVKKHGNIDNYVRDHLKYTTVEQLWKALAAEQIDAVALYLDQFEREQGIIVADQTGLGKGREAAAVIRHAILNGYLPIFFTKSNDLFTDMFRDLRNIGFADIHPFIINNDNDSRIKDAEGNVVFSPLSSNEQYELLVSERKVPTDSKESIDWHRAMGLPLPDISKHPTIVITKVLDHLPSLYDVIFCTYSQVQAAHPFKRQWLEKIVSGGVEGSRKYKRVVFVLDESHMAGGYDSIIGTWMRRVLPKAKCACFLSATFAKYPEVMPFYARKTALRETEMQDITFVEAMVRGGLALQEVVAANLAESGQLIRRQRSKAGIKVEYIELDSEPGRTRNRVRVNQIIKLMNYVVAFERDYIDPVLDRIHTKAYADGEHVKEKPKGLGVKQSPYFSRVFNIVDQMLFSLKVEAVAEQTVKLLNENKKVVICFKSTMGTFLKDLDLVSGDIIEQDQLDFAVTLVKGLDSVFYYNYTDIEGNKTRMQLSLADLSPAGQRRYEEIKQAMLDETTGLTISPIDQLISIIENTKKDKDLGGHKDPSFRVAEVTGRNQRVKFENGQAIVSAFRSDNEKFFRLFNSGHYDVLLINQSGSTGSSAHASVDFKDQRVRAMIIHQFELDINIEMQKWGRIDRTGQVVLPQYYYITTDIPAERRLMVMLKSKLKSLDANTTGSQKTNEDFLQSIDFLNKYGDRAAWDWVSENPDLVERMGWPTYHREKGEYVRNENKDGAIRQVTGRAGLLNVEEQDMLYNTLLNRYEAVVRWEKQRGTYDLETEFLKLDADIKKKFIYRQGKGGRTPFGKDTLREETIINNPTRPFTKDQIDNLLIEELSGEKPKQLQMKLIEEINLDFPRLIEQRKERKMETVTKLQAELDELPEPDVGATDEERKKNEKLRLKTQDLIQVKTTEVNSVVKGMEDFKKDLIRVIGYFEVGQVLKLPADGTLFSWGIFLGIGIAKGGKNPYSPSGINLKFAVADSRKVLEFDLTPEQRPWISHIVEKSKEITPEEVLIVNRDWNELIKDAAKRREWRHILTENIVGAADEIGTYSKLIKYNTKEGTIKNGILLSRNFQKDGEELYSLLPINGALQYLKSLGKDQLFVDHKDRVRFVRQDDATFSIAIPKKGNFQLYTDEVLRSLLERKNDQSEDELPDFVQNAGDMTGNLHIENLEQFLERLKTFGLKYMAKAIELKELEKENEEERREVAVLYKYKLSRPYGQGSNPTICFVAYEEPSNEYRFGIVTYDRPLTDKEKYNYSLIPIYSNSEQPYKAWKTAVEKTALKEELNDVVAKARSQPKLDAILTLGYFIANNPHEDGNHEFVFGDFDEEALGRVAYDDLIGDLSEIEKLIYQLKIELELK